MTKFVIFTLPRTGSTLLSKSLNKHPEIFCDDEIFHFSFRDYFSPHQFRFWKIRFLSKKINYIINFPGTFLRLKNYLDRFYTNAPDESFTARGFKLMYYQTKYTPGLISYIKNNNVKVIILLRENTLRNALSDLRARSTGIYHNESQIEPVLSSLPKLNVNTELLQKKMNSITNQNKKLADVVKDMDHIRIRYEDFADWDNTIDRITSFLGITSQRVPFGARKLNPDNLQDMIENYGEVERWLKENNYGEFAN